MPIRTRAVPHAGVLALELGAWPPQRLDCLGTRHKGKAMPKLADQIAQLQDRLKQLKAREQKQTARERAAETSRKRKADTRRKILVGAIVLARVEQGRLPESELHGWLDEALDRADDRALFGLPAKGSVAP
jgi:hypothetical protein